MPEITSREEARMIADMLGRDDLDEEMRQNMLEALRRYDREQSMAEPTTERIGEAAMGGAAIGVADMIDLAATPITLSAYWARRGLGALGWAGGIDESVSYFGDEGFMDLSGAITQGVREQMGPMSGIEESALGFGRVVGGTVAGLGAGGAMRSIGAAGARTLAGQAATRSIPGYGGGGAVKVLEGAVKSPRLLRSAQRMETAGEWFSAAPKTQLAASLTGEGARQLAEDAEWSAGGQLGAALVGSLGYGAVAQPMMQWGLRTLMGYGRKQSPAKQLESIATLNAHGRAVATFERNVKSKRDELLRQFGDNPTPEQIKMVDETMAELVGFTIPPAPKRTPLYEGAKDFRGEELAKPIPGGMGGGAVRALPFGHKVLANAVDDAATILQRSMALGARKTQRAGQGRERYGIDEDTMLVRAVDDQIAGEAIARSVSPRKMGDYRHAMRTRFLSLDNIVDDAEQVNTLHLYGYLQELRNTAGPAQVRVYDDIMALLDDMGGAVADNIGPGLKIAYAPHRMIRTHILDKVGSPQAMSAEEQHIWRNLYENIFIDETTTFGFDNMRMAALRDGNQMVKTGKRMWDEGLSHLDEFVGARSTDQLFDAVWRARKHAPELIIKLRNAIKSSRGETWATQGAWATVGKGVVQRMILESSTDGQLQLGKFLSQYKAMTPEVRDLLLSDVPGLKNLLKAAADYAERVVKLNVKSAANVKTTIGLGQAAGAVASVTTNFVNPYMMAVASISPWAAAKLMTNEDFVKWLMKSQMGKRDKLTAAANVGHLARIAEDDPTAAPYIMEVLMAIGGINEINATPEKDREAFGD
jgi:hypothetical protein